jgi:transcriptional regulator with XRE-family HTH domain
MANQLRMAVVHAVLTLKRLGWSQRQIAEKLGIDRETVARYVHSRPADSKPATNPIAGSEATGLAIEASILTHHAGYSGTLADSPVADCSRPTPRAPEETMRTFVTFID